MIRCTLVVLSRKLTWQSCIPHPLGCVSFGPACGPLACVSEEAHCSKAAALVLAGGNARNTLRPDTTWYHTEEPPKSTWKSVNAPAGLISAYSRTSGRGCGQQVWDVISDV